MSKYKFGKKAMSLIASAMTLGVSFNSMANPNSKSTLVQLEKYKTDYESFTLKDYENAKNRNFLVYRLLDNSIVGWDMQPIMSADSKQYKCDASVKIPLHPVVQRSQTIWWEQKERNIQCFYLPSIENPNESYLIRCEYDGDGPDDIECVYGSCVKSRCGIPNTNPVLWNRLKNDLDGSPKHPENETGYTMCKFPTKVLASYLPEADKNVMKVVREIGFAGYEKNSSSCNYVVGVGLGALLLSFPFLLDNLDN